ncbi:hypothetical protein HDU96_001137 [Phlyctochytrium bullatum]|nr:hypothetical protein HDU96_001137 [Phlyctochytrium bullatum]
MADPVPLPGDPLQQIITNPLPPSLESSAEITPELIASAQAAASEAKTTPSGSSSFFFSTGLDKPAPDKPSSDSDSDPSSSFPHIGLLTRLAKAVGFLPWVAWQWAIKQLGPLHPVASACLHDACLRTFTDPPPINPGSLDALSFARKEADAAVRAMLAMGVRAQLCTAVAVLGLAKKEIEAATASGDATQALRVQAASMQKQGKAVSKAAQQAAQNAMAAGAKAISRRYIFVMADVEKFLLAHGTEDFETGRVIAPEMVEASNEMVIVEYDSDAVKGTAEKTENGEFKEEDSNTDNPRKTARALMHLYPTTLLPQHRSVWLLGFRTLIVDNAEWRSLTASPVSPNAGRRFYIAASNIVRGLEQFGVPAAAFAALRAKNQDGKAVKSMSSLDSRGTMLYVSWMDELIKEETEATPTGPGTPTSAVSAAPL